jgi:hypothetical protein
VLSGSSCDLAFCASVCAIVAPFVVGLFGATFVQTSLFNRTRGSIFVQMLFHATVNTVGAGLIFPLFNGAALIVLWWVYAAFWLAAGIVLMRFFEEATATPDEPLRARLA